MSQDERTRVHAMIVTMTLDPTRRETVERHLRDDVAAWATARPGFITGRWFRSQDDARGIGVVIFATAEAATAAAVGPRSAPPGPGWAIDSVEIYEQVQHA